MEETRKIDLKGFATLAKSPFTPPWDKDEVLEKIFDIIGGMGMRTGFQTVTFVSGEKMEVDSINGVRTEASSVYHLFVKMMPGYLSILPCLSHVAEELRIAHKKACSLLFPGKSLTMRDLKEIPETNGDGDIKGMEDLPVCEFYFGFTEENLITVTCRYLWRGRTLAERDGSFSWAEPEAFFREVMRYFLGFDMQLPKDGKPRALFSLIRELVTETSVVVYEASAYTYDRLLLVLAAPSAAPFSGVMREKVELITGSPAEISGETALFVVFVSAHTISASGPFPFSRLDAASRPKALLSAINGEKCFFEASLLDIENTVDALGKIACDFLNVLEVERLEG